MLSLSLMQYDLFIVQPHLFEKLVGYLSLDIFSNLPNFKQIVLNYTSNSIRNLKKYNLFRFFLHTFLLERLTFSKPTFILVKDSISDFKIISGQLSGFNVMIHGLCMYNFIYQYMYNSFHVEKNFLGLSIDNIRLNNFGSISMLLRNFFTMPMILDFISSFEELFPEYEPNIGVNISLSTKSILCTLIYFSHLQFPLNDSVYYQFY